MMFFIAMFSRTLFASAEKLNDLIFLLIVGLISTVMSIYLSSAVANNRET